MMHLFIVIFKMKVAVKKVYIFKNLFNLLNLEREGGRQREKDRNFNLLFDLFIHSLVVSCMCPDQRSNSQPWHIQMMV